MKFKLLVLGLLITGLRFIDVWGPGPALATQAPPRGMTLVPAGPFQMGNSFNEGNSDEMPLHTVNVNAFFMDTFELTKALWDEVAAWAAGHGYDIEPADGKGKAPNHPVQEISWYEAVKWTNARSEKEGLVPCYYADGASQLVVYRQGQVDLTNQSVKWNADCYRLPTEAEWEKAARGGVSGHRFQWSDTDTIQHSRANYQSSAFPSYDTSPTSGFNPACKKGKEPFTCPVGSFASNGYGLFDMAGNVWEWTWDWYDPSYYVGSPQDNPRGPSASPDRSKRGGSWGSNAFAVRVALRSFGGPGYQVSNLGFRLVRVVWPTGGENG